MQQPPQNPEQPSYPYQQQPGQGTPPPPPQYPQQPHTQYPPYQQPYTPYDPTYMPPQPLSPKKQRGPWLWIVGGCLGLIVLSIIVGVIIIATAARTVSTQINNAAATVTVAAGNSNTSATQPTTSSSSGGDYKVGQTATVGSMSMTLNSVKTTQGGPYDNLKAGDTFLIVDVTVKNGTGSPKNVSSGVDFKLNDSTGQSYTETVITGETPPDDTALRDGAKLRGQLTYQVPKSMKQFTFTYQPDFLSSDQATWDINL
jgi:hypothetical protein